MESDCDEIDHDNSILARSTSPRRKSKVSFTPKSECLYQIVCFTLCAGRKTCSYRNTQTWGWETERAAEMEAADRASVGI